ncbi:MAG TPA: hypothetical protein VG271_04875 [Beijerinckiaceae bacterium]|jgi:hypothetical protein|nr:hypothetical protein [Beijerinckiaceae bacterium]
MRTTTIAHLYLVGDRVTFNPGIGSNVKAGGAFTVQAQLPPLGDVFQYRIKNDSEPYERVVSEAQLAPLSL